jgi:hypothetical protein
MQFTALAILPQSRRGAEDFGEKLLIGHNFDGLRKRMHPSNQFIEILFIYQKFLVFGVSGRNDNHGVLFGLVKVSRCFRRRSERLTRTEWVRIRVFLTISPLCTQLVYMGDSAYRLGFLRRGGRRTG